jgi:hypothetical protein
MYIKYTNKRIKMLYRYIKVMHQNGIKYIQKKIVSAASSIFKTFARLWGGGVAFILFNI